jgi:hypothetical protein
VNLCSPTLLTGDRDLAHDSVVARRDPRVITCMWQLREVALAVVHGCGGRHWDLYEMRPPAEGAIIAADELLLSADDLNHML